jgi:hypothetical protein
MLLISSVDLGNEMSLAIGSTLKDEETTSRSFHNPFDITGSADQPNQEERTYSLTHPLPQS